LQQIEPRKLSQQEIDKDIFDYYSQLYSSIDQDEQGQWESAFEELSTFDEEEMGKIGSDITCVEITKALFKCMKPGKSPGNNGLTVALYRKYWKLLSPPLMKALQEALKEGELTESQKQSVIRLIRKKDKDPNEIKNWQTISLMNVDV